MAFHACCMPFNAKKLCFQQPRCTFAFAQGAKQELTGSLLAVALQNFHHFSSSEFSGVAENSREKHPSLHSETSFEGTLENFC